MLQRKKKVREFPVPSRDVTTKLSLGGNNDVITKLFLPGGSLVSDIPAGDGKFVSLFLRVGRLYILLPPTISLQILFKTSFSHKQFYRINNHTERNSTNM
jgi:hypothetical protein